MQNASSVFADSPDVFDHDPLVGVWSFHLICPPNPSESKCYDLGFSADTEAKVDGQLELYLRLRTFSFLLSSCLISILYIFLYSFHSLFSF